MKVKDLISAINLNVPFQLQEEYDNSGLLVGMPDAEISKGLICLDITEDIIEEAIREKCDVIISHHPLIFSGLKKITGESPADRIIIKAIKHDIAIIAVHTNIDNSYFGVNEKLASKLGLKDLKILSPQKGRLKKLVVFCPYDHADKVREAMFAAGAGVIGDYDKCSYNIEGKGSFRASENSNPFAGEKDKLHFEPEYRIETILPDYLTKKVVAEMINAHPYEEVAYDIYPIDNDFERAGAGMIGTLDNECSETEFLELVKNKLNVPTLRHSGLTNKKIKIVALCGGSGSFLLNAAINAKADIFITGDVKYHSFFEAQNNILLVDAGHFETEQFTSEVLYEIVSKKFTNFALRISKKQINPVNYF